MVNAAVAEILGLIPSTYMEVYTMQDAEDLMFSSGLPMYQTHIRCTNMQAGKNTHTDKKFYKNKKGFQGRVQVGNS